MMIISRQIAKKSKKLAPKKITKLSSTTSLLYSTKATGEKQVTSRDINALDEDISKLVDKLNKEGEDNALEEQVTKLVKEGNQLLKEKYPETESLNSFNITNAKNELLKLKKEGKEEQLKELATLMKFGLVPKGTTGTLESLGVKAVELGEQTGKYIKCLGAILCDETEFYPWRKHENLFTHTKPPRSFKESEEITKQSFNRNMYNHPSAMVNSFPDLARAKELGLRTDIVNAIFAKERMEQPWKETWEDPNLSQTNKFALLRINTHRNSYRENRVRYGILPDDVRVHGHQDHLRKSIFRLPTEAGIRREQRTLKTRLIHFSARFEDEKKDDPKSDHRDIAIPTDEETATNETQPFAIQALMEDLLQRCFRYNDTILNMRIHWFDWLAVNEPKLRFLDSRMPKLTEIFGPLVFESALPQHPPKSTFGIEPRDPGLKLKRSTSVWEERVPFTW